MLEYDHNDRLKSILFDCEMTDKQHAQFIRVIPLFEADFLERANRSKVVYSTVPADLSFSAFWNAYAYKVGDKARAEKLWNKLSEAEKVTALKAIPAYNYFLKTKKIDKTYAETWLNQKRFLTNEY
jgi:hypothetical protein